MYTTVNTDVLRKKLSRAKIQREPIVIKVEPPYNNTEELNYLIENVFKPLINGEQVHTAGLDFTRFENEDIAMLNEYYYKYFHDNSSDWKKLKQIFTVCNNSFPNTSNINFL